MLESVLAGQIQNYLEQEKRDCHHYSMGSDKVDQLSGIKKLHEVIAEVIQRRKMASTVVLDISNVFNFLLWNSIRTLEIKKISAYFRRILHSYLSYRWLMFTYRD